MPSLGWHWYHSKKNGLLKGMNRIYVFHIKGEHTTLIGLGMVRADCSVGVMPNTSGGFQHFE